MKIGKKLKFLIIISIVICIMGLTFFIIDYIRVSKQKLPIFAIETTAFLDGGTTIYTGLGYKVIDFNSVGGYDEIKIGSWNMSIYDFEEERRICEKGFYEGNEEKNVIEEKKEKQQVTEEKEKEQQEIKIIKENISDDRLFDSLKLRVGDIYNVESKNGFIVVFCSVISGEKPKIGDVFALESKEDGYVCKATVYEVEERSNSDGSKLLLVYFEGARAEDLEFTPQIRRLK